MGLKKVTLKSSDDRVFEVEEAAALASQLIKNMIEDDCANDVIPLPNVTSNILSMVIDYCKKHVEMQKLGDDEDSDDSDWEGVTGTGKSGVTGMNGILSPGMQTSLRSICLPSSISSCFYGPNSSQISAFLVFKAANYLNITSLLDLACQTVADMIKGKTHEEILKTFNIKNDFSPEEEEEVMRENQWAFE